MDGGILRAAIRFWTEKDQLGIYDLLLPVEQNDYIYATDLPA